MCGIAGIYGPGFKKDLVKRMCDVLAHRGPDGEGFYEDDKITLGHRRLSIIDPSPAGAQPMSNEDGTIWIVFNGEIYNFQALRKFLQERGHRFRSRTDTEVIIHLYEEYPADFVKRLDGIFAFAIWDKRKRELLLARDYFGIKPLHYYYNSDLLIFSSEIKGILATGFYRPAPDHQALHDLLNLRYVPGDQTLFKDIRRLPAGTVMRVCDHRFSKNKYYHLPAVSTQHKRSEQEMSEQIEHLLSASVKKQLVSDVPVGVYLSGGMDSSSLVALQRAHCPQQLISTFTLKFASEADESADAQSVADYFKTDHHVFDAASNPLAKMREVLWHVEEPKINSLQGYILAQNASRFVKVVHGGLGGDELFAGYAYHKYIAMVQGFSNKIPAYLKKNIFPGLSSLVYTLQNRWGPMNLDEYRRGIQMFLAGGDPSAVYLIPRNVWDMDRDNWKMIYNKDFLTGDIQPVRRFFDGYFKEPSTPFLDQILYAEFQTKMMDDLLLNDDRISMAHGLEVRVPLLDKDLVEYAFSIPAEMKLKKGQPKSLMRESFRKHLPERIINKRKAGFQFDVSQQYQMGLRNFLTEILTEPRIREQGVFNYQYIRKILSANPSPRLRWHYFLLWLIAGFSLWSDIFITDFDQAQWQPRPGTRQ